MVQSGCAWWDRLIGVAIPPESLHCLAMDSADALWHGVAKYWLPSRGDTMSARFLEHSLEDHPGPINNDPEAIAKMSKAVELQAKIKGLPIGHYDNLAFDDIEFDADEDLRWTFHKVHGHLSGDRTPTGAHFHVVVQDTYDFDANSNYSGSLLDQLATLGANVGWLSQMMGVIHPFETTTSFDMSATYLGAGSGPGQSSGSGPTPPSPPNCNGARSCGGHCCPPDTQLCGRNGACCDGKTCTPNCPC
jgi:hypothetical protein